MHKRTTVLAVVTLLLVVVSTGGRAAPGDGDALPYAKGFLGTLDYVTSTVDLTEQGNPIDPFGFSTATFDISGVPADADVVAAYLYWETITLEADPTLAAGAKFRDHELVLNDATAVKQSSVVDATASCWGSGQPLTLTSFRADVLHMLPLRKDADDKATSKRLVNSADLVRHGEAAHTAYLPARQGNQVPETAGATLVIIFSAASEPLRKIVIYDGIYKQPSLSTAMTQTLQGFYRSAATVPAGEAKAKLTHILAAGQPNANERILFNDTNGFPATGTPQQQLAQMQLISAPDPVAGGTASQRGWATLTYDVSSRMNPNANSGAYGETARTWVDHSGGGAYDCLTWGAVIFAVAVEDDDPSGDPANPTQIGDGLPDGLEAAAAGLLDPDGTALPNLNAMGANENQRDLFIEVNAMWAPGGTTYGRPGGFDVDPQDQFPPFNYFVTDSSGHQHLPTPADLANVGQAFLNRGIRVHFDVGKWVRDNLTDPLGYKEWPNVIHSDWVDVYNSNVADTYLVPSAHARGGELVQERKSPDSHFADFAGVVGWKLGLQLYRDEPVANNGAEFAPVPDGNTYAAWNPANGRRRFDRARFGLFHYLFYGHSRGTPKSLPCLVSGFPGPYDAQNGTACETPNPTFNPNQYHVPSSSSGVADLPGGNILITLGLWDEFVGKPFVRASTTLHEIGHNLNLWHGGKAAVWGDQAPAVGDPTPTTVEPNCKPNYQSSMSYLFQVHGLFDAFGNINLNFSTSALASLDDTAPPADGPWSPTTAYAWAWYAPASSPLAATLGVSAATRYCSGAVFPPNPNPAMARVYTTSPAGSIDWDGGYVVSQGQVLDVNFDNAHPTTLSGFNDWGNLRLNQISLGRRAAKLQVKLPEDAPQEYGDFIDFGSGDFIDFGSGDFIDFGSGDFIDFGSGDFIDFGSGVTFQESSGDFIDFGSGDFIDFGSGDFIDFGSGQEMDYDIARSLGRPNPFGLTGCVLGAVGCASLSGDTRIGKVELNWQASTVGRATYVVYRKRGGVNSTFPFAQIGTTSRNYFVDPDNLGNGSEYTYRVRAEFRDTGAVQFSGYSNLFPITYVRVR